MARAAGLVAGKIRGHLLQEKEITAGRKELSSD